MVLVYDLADPVELQGFVRNVPTPMYDLIQNVLPGENIADLEYRFMRGDLGEMDVAPFRGFDTEAPIGNRPGVARVRGELPPISRKIPIGEEQRLRLEQLRRGGGQVQGIADAIFDDAARLARSLLGRLELAAGQSLDTGVLTINENGVAAQIDYGFTAGQKPTAATLWSNPAADIIADLTTWSDEWAERNGGERPGRIRVSKRVRGFMLRNDAIRTLAASLAGAPRVITPTQLGQVFDAYELPPIEVYDTTVKVGGVTTRTVRDTQVLILPAGRLGRTFFGITAEALELVNAQQIRADIAPGMVAVNDRNFDPPQTWTKVAAIALPTIQNPAGVTSATVL